MKKLGITCAVAACVGMAWGAMAGSDKKMNIVETAAKAGSFETLLAAAKAAGLAETLSGKGEFTVFAPTDDAFARLPAGTVDALLADPDRLRTVLLHHVVAERVPAAKVLESKHLKPMSGQALAVSTDSGATIGGSGIVKTDITCTNGIIHVIDTVLLPADLVGFAAATPDFGTLVAAVGAAGLADTLAGTGPFTVFAPTDAAFAALPDGTLDSLLQPENKDKLVEILTYHVVPGHYTAEEVIAMDSATSVQGSQMEFRTERNGDGGLEAVYVDGARIVKTDLFGLNGVIHVIDSVITP